MLNFLAELADRYTEDPDPTPELSLYHYVSRVFGRHPQPDAASGPRRAC